MTAMEAPREGLDLGRVIQETFQVLGRNFPTFAVLALVLTTLPAAVAALIQQQTLGPSDSTAATVTKLLAWMVPVVTGAVLQGAITFSTIANLNDRRPTISESLAVGLRAFLPLIAIGIVLTIALIIGFILLIVPGLIMLVYWIVVTPAYVAEQRGIGEAFGRSAELTAGNRWTIFGLILLYGCAFWIGAIIVGALSGGSMLNGGDVSLVRAAVISPLYSGLFSLVGATGTAVIYVELRRIREGASPEHLAAIFD
jgi:hypothetical protein